MKSRSNNDDNGFVTLSWNISTNFTRFSSTERPRGAYGMMVSVDGVDANSELVSSQISVVVA